MTKQIFEISTGEGREEYSQIGFIIGTDKTDLRKLYVAFEKAYQYPSQYPGDQDFDEWYEADRKALEAARADGLEGLMRYDLFYDWLIKKKRFARPDIWEVNI